MVKGVTLPRKLASCRTSAKSKWNLTPREWCSSSRKTKIRVGSLNVRTLYQTRKLQQVLREVESYNIVLLCVSEARWIYSGKRTSSTGHTILYSGQTDHQHRGGVATIMDGKLENVLLDWKPISNRLNKARFNCKFAKLTVIACDL